MAEGLIGGILGDEDEKPEVEGPEPLTSAHAYAAAVAAIASRQDPGVARKTEEFLSEQSHLLKIQAQLLKDEHALRLTNLRGQSYEGRLRRAGIRIRIAFQVFAAAVAGAIGAGLLIMIHDAVTSRQVVVEPNWVDCKVLPAAMRWRGACPVHGPAISSSKCRRWAFPSRKYRAYSGSGSDMTCISTETSLRSKRAISH